MRKSKACRILLGLILLVLGSIAVGVAKMLNSEGASRVFLENEI